MQAGSRAEIDLMMSHSEETWRHFDTLFDAIETEGRWSDKHGEDWVFADLPYHFGYCERDLVARVLELGPDVPEEERWEVRSISQLNAWNARKFAERPADQTVQRSLEQMHASRDAVRREAAKLSDADLDIPAWFPLTFGMGWQTKRVALGFCRQHAWNEFIQLRVHMGRHTPVPSPGVTSMGLESYLNLSLLFLDREAAKNTSLTAVMEFTDEGVGAWTVKIKDGQGTVTEGATEKADLVMTQSAEAFVKTMNQMHDPAEAMQKGEFKVDNFEALAMYGALFPPPDPDHIY